MFRTEILRGVGVKVLTPLTTIYRTRGDGADLCPRLTVECCECVFE